VWKNDSPPSRAEIEGLRWAHAAARCCPAAPPHARLAWLPCQQAAVRASSAACLPSRQQTWRMFDFGFKNYMQHAFPQVGCGGTPAPCCKCARGGDQPP
jgi:hypothetical protein